MPLIHAKIILDSIGADGSAPRLTTWLLVMPRCVLAEFNTHRAFSRNAASSRAIPVQRKLSECWSHPFIPIEWGLNKPGMQATREATGWRRLAACATWRLASWFAMGFAWIMHCLGIHKQIVNRIFEPFTYVEVMMTSTQEGLENFFRLRADELAEPHMRRLAYLMLAIYNTNQPQVLKRGEWHVPFGDVMPPDRDLDEQLKIAVARAARLSYNNRDRVTSDVEKDIALHDKLANDGHWSSFEHAAKCPENEDEARKSGNLKGWMQLRKLYPNECRRDCRAKDVALCLPTTSGPECCDSQPAGKLSRAESYSISLPVITQPTSTCEH